jgi:hypothetical protein
MKRPANSKPEGLQDSVGGFGQGNTQNLKVKIKKGATLKCTLNPLRTIKSLQTEGV